MSRSNLADFEIISRLGQGSFGTVYKVRRLVDNKLYVIKNVRIVELSYKEQSEAINEVQILAQLKSPYVVRYFDSFIEKESLHIVMEFCNRGDLQKLIKKAKDKNLVGLDEYLIWNISLQVILGLQYLHKKNILHRDLKSANVFLMKDTTRSHYLVKIGDLGVAKLMDTSTALANTIVGTPYYLSPELCADKPYRDRSDCWALGVLIYECCTLHHPFEARNQCALIMKIIEAQVKPPATVSKISKELNNLTLWLLQKDPNQRPSIKHILNESFVQDRLAELDFELPIDMDGLETTTTLSTGRFGPEVTPEKQPWAKTVPKIPVEQPVESSSVAGNENLAGNVDRKEEVGAKPDGQQRSGMVKAASRTGSKAKLGISGNLPQPLVRGDRVRGSVVKNKRIVSEKARSRHQVKPVSNSTSAVNIRDYQDSNGAKNDSQDQLGSGSFDDVTNDNESDAKDFDLRASMRQSKIDEKAIARAVELAVDVNAELQAKVSPTSAQSPRPRSRSFGRDVSRYLFSDKPDADAVGGELASGVIDGAVLDSGGGRGNERGLSLVHPVADDSFDNEDAQEKPSRLSRPGTARDIAKEEDDVAQRYHSTGDSNFSDMHMQTGEMWDPVWTQHRGVIPRQGVGETRRDSKDFLALQEQLSASMQGALSALLDDSPDPGEEQQGLAAAKGTAQSLAYTGLEYNEDFAEDGEEWDTIHHDQDSREEIEDDIEPLEEAITEARTRAISALGESLFQKVYDLCSRHMSAENEQDFAKVATSYMKDLEFYQAEAGVDAACEVVFGVKVLLAMEAKYDEYLSAIKPHR